MLEPLRKFEKRYINVDGHKVEFYFYGDHITPSIKVSVIKEVKNWLFVKIEQVYSENHYMHEIKSYRETAKDVVDRYKNEFKKWE